MARLKEPEHVVTTKCKHDPRPDPRPGKIRANMDILGVTVRLWIWSVD